MTKQIFKHMQILITIALVAAFAAVLGILYSYFGVVQEGQVRSEAKLAAQGVEADGISYLEKLDLDTTRVTLIASDGQVLYDSEADAVTLENHADRPEVKAALADGEGTSIRFSGTLLKSFVYCAERLSDGTVLRVAEPRDTALNIAAGMIPFVLMLIIILMVCMWFAARRVAKHITQPLNQLDLDHPMENNEYEEISPLLGRIYTQQKQIADEKGRLVRIERDFTAVTQHMAEGLILLDEEGRILNMNNKAGKLLNAGDVYIGTDILALERREKFRKVLAGALLEGEHGETVLPYDRLSYQVDVTPVLDGRKVIGTVVLLFDVTERETAEQMRREFTANVSHELKTPLHTISGCAEMLESGGVKPEDQKKFVHLIYTQVQRMITLVQDILYISHLDEGAVDMNCVKIDMCLMTNKVIESLSHEAEKKHVSVSLESDGEVIYYGVARLTESIIFNLVDNAIKYNKEGGAVHVSLHAGAHTVTLKVADNGIGIPEEDQSRIFERFYRVDKSRSREIGGTGLGLAIVKHAAMLQNAQIKLDSRIGEGSTFTVIFPEKAPDEKAPMIV
ncbi:MAG: ATP-binding protein [Lachnospiraceae bacterium]|nr:ATP-binding protein [Lachnospiraceae bacterium]